MRYGSLFTSHIMGCPTVVCVDPELNRHILMSEGKGLVPGYPKPMLDVLGKWNIAAVDGSLHKAIRGTLMGLISPTMIREQLLPKINDFMRSYLSRWNDKVIDIQEKSKEVWLLLAMKLIAGIETDSVALALKSDFLRLYAGTVCLPINFPGTNYHCGLQARKKIISMLKKLIEERRRAEERRAYPISQTDMLDSLLKNDFSEKAKLTDEQIIDIIITLFQSGMDTVTTTMMMAVKYLHDHPRVLEELRNEHFIVRKGKQPEDMIDWNDYKSMNFTRAVIFETLRLATIVNGVHRKATQDFDTKGVFVPKGWRILVYLREINYDPLMYPEPFTFNPWRWLDKKLESHQYFLAFGGGGRLCPGKELGTVTIAVFLHYFVTKYRWEEVGGNSLVMFPRIEAPNGLHIRVSDY